MIIKIQRRSFLFHQSFPLCLLAADELLITSAFFDGNDDKRKKGGEFVFFVILWCLKATVQLCYLQSHHPRGGSVFSIKDPGRHSPSSCREFFNETEKTKEKDSRVAGVEVSLWIFVFNNKNNDANNRVWSFSIINDIVILP